MTSQDATGTYRLQFSKDFTFQDALEIVDSLHARGVRTLYYSPVFEAAAGSNHGYDNTDFARISAERGGEAAFRALDAKLRAMDPPMQAVLDIVPNHMAAKTSNPYWSDVLARGRESPHWRLFDMRVEDGGKVEVPTLGCGFSEALARGEIKIKPGADGRPQLFYWDNAFPLSDASVQKLQGAELEKLSADEIRAVAETQNYALVDWRTTAARVSYRRFFDINELIGLRVEDPEVFAATHAKLFELTAQCPSIAGVRVDHIDGLVDPAAYLARLQEHIPHVRVEKILGPGEKLPQGWSEGTTGYEFTAWLNDMLTRKEGFGRIEAFWRSETQTGYESFSDCVTDCKRKALDDLFQSELGRLARLSGGGAEAKIFWTGLTVGLDVYRTYAAGEDMQPDEGDRIRIRAASELAAARFGESYIAAAAKFLDGVLHPETPEQKQALREWQQLSGPAMAKGLEDTAHYRYTPLAGLNEVGCTPELGRENDFAWLQERADTAPRALNATSTHDTKRSEDVRYRLLALSGMPEEWIGYYKTAAEMNAPLKKDGMPAAATEYLFYQSVVATWPLNGEIDDAYRARLQKYMEKAVKEAKLETNWWTPNRPYETALAEFIDGALRNPGFLGETRRLAEKTARAGAILSLDALALKTLSPGVPDIYQGTETWGDSLVDPDNRRQVDYKAAADTFNAAASLERAEGRGALIESLTRDWKTGAIKQWLTAQFLSIREKHLLPMGALDVRQLEVTGPRADDVIAYQLQSREKGGEKLVVVLPRSAAGLNGGLSYERLAWQGTAVRIDAADGPGRELLTNAEVPSGQIPVPTRLPVSVMAFGKPL